MDQSFVVGSIQTKAGEIPQVSPSLTWADRMGSYKVRWRIGRMNYKVDPGLYAIGRPGDRSPVFVSANYKMSFDRLREALAGRDAWILVLDTRGINVWCAAGKGTFGTTELADRIESSRLGEVVSHREVILPQLAGPGVSAHQVKRLSGFQVIYGPIRVADLQAFWDAGFKATPEMRVKTFTTWERTVLIPVELVGALKEGGIVLAVFFLADSLWGAGEFLKDGWGHGLYSVLAFLMAILAGAVLTPLLLPWLPGRAFSVKGLILGLLAGLTFMIARWSCWSTWAGRLELGAWFLLIPAVSAYLGMNFTGASTYTSLSGVKKEMRFALPAQIAAAVVGVALWLGSRLTY
jgi:acetyl-CoA decarbonylase/synthase complex subunit gamma